ncbi:MAG: hypothetical protein K0U66_10305, partial [Gammaproteobacteria bacterium]|nr:hypothetical protein [Gammaproteobacteria bacterium]
VASLASNAPPPVLAKTKAAGKATSTVRAWSAKLARTGAANVVGVAGVAAGLLLPQAANNSGNKAIAKAARGDRMEAAAVRLDVGVREGAATVEIQATAVLERARAEGVVWALKGAGLNEVITRWSEKTDK